MTNASRGLAAALALLAAGCATVQMAPPERDLAAKQFQGPAPGQASLYVYRNESFGGAAKMGLVLDGRFLGETGPRVFHWVGIAPGRHQLVSTAENQSVLDFDAQAGQSVFVWQEVKMGLLQPRTQLHLVDESSGRSGVAECSLAESWIARQ